MQMATNIIVFIKLIFSLILSFILSIFFTKKIIKISQKNKATQIEREYLDNHVAKKGTPTMGGVGFVLASLITFFIVNFTESLNYGVIAVIVA